MSARIGWRTCAALAVRTLRSASWKRRHAAIERQAAEFEQRADFGFGIGDQLLVDDIVDRARITPVPEAHETVVFAPERGDLGKVVGEPELLRERLAKARETILERIAAAIDEARARQHRADRADVAPVRKRPCR